MKKILSTNELRESAMNSVGDPPISSCLTGSCPTIFDYDDNNYIVQGFVCSGEVKRKLNLPANEDVVIVPKRLIHELNKGGK